MENVDLTPIVYDDLEPVSIQVSYMKQPYVLRELDEGAATKVTNARIAAARFEDGEINRVERAAEVQPLALSLGLFRVNTDGTESPVSIETLKGDGKKTRGWPSRLTKPLYDKLMEISGMDDKTTLEQLDKQIARLERRRAQLKKGISAPKVQPDDTAGTSG